MEKCELDSAESESSSKICCFRKEKKQRFPTTSNFYCNLERVVCYTILASIIIGYVLFMINDAPYVTENFTLAVPVVLSLLFLTTVTNQLLASFKNPGIIESQDSENRNEEINPTPINEKEGLVHVRMNGEIQNLKFCRTCKIIRPPRSSHCKRCNVCVHRSDHHCPYLGNCIGLKNYKNFYYFLVSVVLLTANGFTFAFLHLLDVQEKVGGSWWEAVESCPISFIVMAASVAGGSFPLCLVVFHTYVVCAGVTSREVIRKYDAEALRSRNPIKNCFVILCKTKRPNMQDIELVT